MARAAERASKGDIRGAAQNVKVAGHHVGNKIQSTVSRVSSLGKGRR
jgi:hypothetical protein